MTTATNASHKGNDLFADSANLLMIVAAIIAILLTVPEGRLHEEARK